MKINKISKLNTNISAKLVPILACLFPILCLAYGKGYKAIPAILLLFSLPVLFSTSRKILTKDVNVLIGAFLLYFSIFAFSTLLVAPFKAALNFLRRNVDDFVKNF